MSIPLVSVVIPCYNYGHYIEEAIESVLNSTYSNVEIIVVDDGSNDPLTCNVLDLLSHTESVTVIRQVNKGLSAARNTGIAHSIGEYIVTLDADDLLEPTFLMKSIWHLERKPQLGIIYSFVQLFGDVDEIWRTEEFNFSLLLHHNYIPATAMYRREIWQAVGGYDEEMRDGYEDWEFWIRCTALGWEAKRISEPLFMYRKHGHSMITDSRNKHEKIVRYIHRKHNSLYNFRMKVDIYRYYARVKGRRLFRKLKTKFISYIPFRLKKQIRVIYHKLFPFSEISLPYYSEKGNKNVVCLGGGMDERVGIMILLPWLKVGGVERVFLDILSQMDRSRFRIYLITTLDDEHPWAYRFIPMVDQVMHLPKFCKSEQEQVDFLCDYIKVNRITCLHLSNSQFAYRFSPVIKKVTNIKVLDTLHMEEPYEPWDYFRYSKMYRESIDTRVVITKNLLKRLIDIYGEVTEKVQVIENGINVEDFNPDLYPIDKRDSIVFIGRFVEQKQPLLFVEIAAKLLKYDSNLDFLMVGDGPMFRNVERRISKLGLSGKIILTGRIDNVQSILGERARLLVAPSKREGLSILGLEAMAMKVPIVASDVPGWNDLIDSGIDGLLVPVNDIDAFVENIVELFRNQAGLMSMGKKAREKAHTYYCSKRMSQRYQELYEASRTQPHSRGVVDVNVS